jgi:hypothetical protein
LRISPMPCMRSASDPWRARRCSACRCLLTAALTAAG